MMKLLFFICIETITFLYIAFIIFIFKTDVFQVGEFKDVFVTAIFTEYIIIIFLTPFNIYFAGVFDKNDKNGIKYIILKTHFLTVTAFLIYYIFSVIYFNKSYLMLFLFILLFAVNWYYLRKYKNLKVNLDTVLGLKIIIIMFYIFVLMGQFAYTQFQIRSTTNRTIENNTFCRGIFSMFYPKRFD